MNTIKIEIVSAEKDLFSGETTMVVAPGSAGDLGIAPQHTPLLTTLRPGDVEVQSPSGEKELFYVSGGVLEVQPHLITILADAALHASELDEDAALEAKTLAEEALKSAAKKEDLDHAQAQLAEAAARYKAVQKLKGKK